jgi:hypothetical protein
MSYEYHVFVSYRRELLWTPWTRDHFKRLLTSYLQQELKEPPRIFVDERIEIGADYVNTLADGLAKSRAFVALFSGDYFSSPWCLHELDLMLDRSGGHPRSIFPVLVHDCEDLPSPIDRVQSVDFKEFRNTHLCETSSKYENFSNAVRTFAPQLAQVIRNAPAFKNSWTATCATRLNAVYSATKTGSCLSPSHFAPPAVQSLLNLPRLNP